MSQTAYSRAAGFSLAALASVIGNRGGFVGADGLFRFDEEGIAERGLAIFEVAIGGETRIVSPAPSRFDAGEPAPDGG